MAEAAGTKADSAGSPLRHALRFILLVGRISLFADMTYEGARSITGPFLAVLGASATVVGIVAGAGELLGYGLRLASGYLSDRTGRYWAITIAGYALNLFAVPLLALADHWLIAAVLIMAERAGRGIRTPARDAMLSHASTRTGLGWGFGLHGTRMPQWRALSRPADKFFQAYEGYISSHDYRRADDADLAALAERIRSERRSV